MSARPQVGTQPPWSHQKPWPGRKVNGGGEAELIKHMTNVPGYLRGNAERMEGAPLHQESALSIGVMEWEVLEKWASNQRRFSMEESTSSNCDSPVSFSSSSPSLRSADSPLSLSKQYSPLSDGWNSCSRDGDYAELQGGPARAKDAEKLATSSVSRYNEASATSLESVGATKAKEGSLVESGATKCRKSLSYYYSENGRPQRLSYKEDNSAGSTHNRSTVPFEASNLISNSDQVRLRVGNGTRRNSGGGELFMKFSDISGKLVKVYMADGVDVNHARGGKVLGRQLSTGQKWPGIIPFLRHHSPARNARPSTSSDGVQDDQDPQSSSRRRSPLRRMIEPLLKPKDRRRMLGSSTISNNTQPSTPGMASPMDESGKHANVDRLNSCVNRNSEAGPVDIPVVTAREKCSGSIKQALVQLSWNQEVPLIIFSAGEGHLLSATLKKGASKRGHNADTVYTISFLREANKENGVRNNHTSKSKIQGFFSTSVAQMRVSNSVLSIYKSESHPVLREFVLLGNELEPSSREPVVSSFKNEIAAILVKVHQEGQGQGNSMQMSGDGVRENSRQMNASDESCSARLGDLLVKDDAKAQNHGDIVAILPRGVHSSPEEGVLPSLIQRWRLGGSCDCGGWDEGCVLNILSDLGDEEGKNSQSSPCRRNKDGSFRIDLFPKGNSRDTRHAFSLVAFKEWLYTIEFVRPISSLQAFGICIAALHDRCSRRPLHQPTHFKGVSENGPMVAEGRRL